MTTDAGEITQLLQSWRAGDHDAESKIFEALLPELRKIAVRCFRREDAAHSLQPTLLVNEAFLRLAAAKKIDWQDRGHFLAMAAKMMRRYLIDHWREKGSVQFLPLEGLPERIAGTYSDVELATALDKLLDELSKVSPQQRVIVELKFFLGMSDAEIADNLNLTLHTAQREWYRARKWLFDRLKAGDGNHCR
jgi:RNA polymerase sigma factor (TIGR02999 family)